MPEIPTYESKLFPPVEKAIPHLPGPLHIPERLTSPWTAASAAGLAMEKQGFDWIENLQHIDTVNTLSEARAQGIVGLNDLNNEITSSPEAASDPQAAYTNWQSKAEQIRANIVQSHNIDPETRLGAEFNATWQNLLAHHDVTLTNELKRNSENAALATGLRTLQTSANAIGDSVSPDLAYQSMKNIKVQVEGLVKTGALKASQGAELEKRYLDHGLSAYGHNLISQGNPGEALRQIDKQALPGAGEAHTDTFPLSWLDDTMKASLRSEAQNKINMMSNQADADRRRMEADRQMDANIDASRKLVDTFKLTTPQANVEGAVRTLYDPNWQAANGLTNIEQVENVRKYVEGGVKDFESAVKKAKDQADDELMTQTVNGTLRTNDILSFKGTNNATPSGKGLEAAIRWMNSDDNAKNRTDPRLYASLAVEIADNPAFDVTKLNDYVANGLSKSDWQSLRDQYTASKDPEKAQSLRYAKDAFFSKYAVGGVIPDKAQRLYPRFVTDFAQQMQQQKLTGMQAHDLADKMLQDVNREYVDSWFSGRWSGQVGALEYAEYWGRWPTPAMGPARHPMPAPPGPTSAPKEETVPNPFIPPSGETPPAAAKPRMESDEGFRKWVAGHLQEAGAPTTDANIDAVIKRYRAINPNIDKEYHRYKTHGE